MASLCPRATMAQQVVHKMFTSLRQLLALRSQEMHDLTLRVKHAEDTIALCEARIERLRVRSYGPRHSPTDPSAPAPGSRAEKDAILRDHLAGVRRARAAESG